MAVLAVFTLANLEEETIGRRDKDRAEEAIIRKFLFIYKTYQFVRETGQSFCLQTVRLQEDGTIRWFAASECYS